MTCSRSVSLTRSRTGMGTGTSSGGVGRQWFSKGRRSVKNRVETA